MGRIIITGGAGFIGSHLAEDLLNKGYDVKVIDNLARGRWSNIRGLFNYERFRFVLGDVRDRQLLLEEIGEDDVVFHLAALVHVDESVIEPDKIFDVNVVGTLNVLNVALKRKAGLVVYASSSEVYGTAQTSVIDELHPLNPMSPYAASKVAGDRYCFAYYTSYRLPIVVARCFNTFGSRQADIGYAGVISKFIRRVVRGLPPLIYGDGKQTRDYMFVKDTVMAYEKILENKENVLGMAINFGTGREVTINALADRIIKLCGKEGEIEPVHVAPRVGEVRRLCADITLAKKLLGFSPKYTLEEGLEETVGWYLRGENDD